MLVSTHKIGAFLPIRGLLAEAKSSTLLILEMGAHCLLGSHEISPSQRLQDRPMVLNAVAPRAQSDG